MASYGYDDAKEADKESFALPNATTRLRACLRCKIILSSQQFLREGCPNCTDLDMIGDRTAVDQLTTRNYSGAAAIVDPKTSWVGRNIKADTLIAGVYAISVQGYGLDGADIGQDEYELE